MAVLVVVLIIISAVLISKNNDYKKMNTKLKEKIKNLEKELLKYKNGEIEVNQTDALIEHKSNETPKKVEVSNFYEVSQEEISNNVKKVKEVKEEREPINTEGIKNKFILMTGAMLIVLAAIVFLTSTWNTIPNIVKTSVIVLLVGVFLGASKIAKKVFDLVETANTFFYMALAYLPISLFSISLFGLLGDYLSISGDGGDLYFALSTAFLSVLYFIIGKTRKQNVLIHISMITQFITLIFLSRCIDAKIEVFMLVLTIYSLILRSVKNNAFKDYKNIFAIYSEIYLYGTLITEIALLLSEGLFVSVIANVLLIFGLYLLYLERKGYVNIIVFLTGILVLVLSILNVKLDIFDISMKHLIFYVATVEMFVIGLLSKNIKWKESSVLISMISTIIFYFHTLILNNSIVLIKADIILWTLVVFSILGYLLLKQRRVVFIHLIPTTLFFASINTIIEFNISFQYLIVISTISFLLSIIKVLKEKENNFILEIYSNAMIVISLVICCVIDSEELLSNVFIFIMLLFAYCTAFLKNEKMVIYKIVAYALINFVLYSILKKCDILNCEKYILGITTVIIAIIELLVEKLQDEYSKYYLISTFVLSILILNFEIDIYTFIAVLTLSMTFYWFFKTRKLNHYFIIIPLIAVIPGVYINNWSEEIMTYLTYVLDFALITLTTVISIKNEKINLYTIMAGVYIAFQAIGLEFNIYLNLCIALVFAIIHFIKMPEEKVKFELGIYVLSLAIYNNIVKDISELNTTIDSISAFKYLGYIVATILTSRNIIKEHVKDNFYKVFEYFALAIIYLTAFGNYSTETDGMIFIFMLVALTIYSYLKKYGPVFFTSVIAIVVNAFYLTQEFWISIPWWVYMLVIGSILIIFAIRNELNEKQQKELLKNKIKNFTKNLNM